jgi:lipopolysaccharide/colanic/teichoic acid biosynthesis glycosyltransferase
MNQRTPSNAAPIPAPLLLYDQQQSRQEVRYAAVPARAGTDPVSRWLNVLVALVGLVLTFPLMVLIAIAV